MACVLVCALGLVCLAARAGWSQAAPASASQATPAAQPGSVAQPAPASSGGGADPIAIVSIDASDPDGAATVTGALEVTGGKAKIAAGGSITSGARTAEVVLPHRGLLRVCASTTVKLAADTSVPAGETPGLLMALDRGAVEMSFATTRAAGANADLVLTPDFRILIAGPGSSELKVRLGEGGDTCVDNSGINAPYVVVTSLFDPGLYRVQPGQRVMFQHGSLSEVVDDEKEPCGCPPPPAQAAGNEFPLAQSEGLAPTPVPAPAPKQPASGTAANVAPLVYSANSAPTATATSPAIPAAAQATQTNPPAPSTQQKKPGFFTRIGHFFRKVFGAE
jgi:hypothetical protein